ncbi:hypothetical protein N7462_004380 [Penicillium macrosclerotiorum]|uniref:uncharacterized protein n=1 Tax=Penicillium macrosclerotiorum TaxID=303699 RepID=UPI002548EF74|nr:uncharacterized protein N7462_004380 [Penicillium macrosclerotiorum]KAJ5689988.1 hypothetical protein N7462_004380 [Penicillium macrosclerotiorum]
MVLKKGLTQSTTVDQVRAGSIGTSAESPIDALIIGTGPSGMVCLRNLLRDDPPLAVMAVDRQAIPGGIWNGHIPAYSTLQDLVCEYECHGVRFPRREPARRASRDQIAEFCHAYFKEFDLKDHVLWQHDVAKVEMVKPMLHQVTLRPFVDGLESPVSQTIYTRSVLVCTGHNMEPYMPEFLGQETAKFPIKHNNNIRDAKELPESDILVVGAGPSALDIIQEACITQDAKDVHLVARSAHWGTPDLWWPWLWHLGWTELHLMRVLYRVMPIFVVDTIFYYIHLIWALIQGVPEWRPPLLPAYHAGQFRIHNNTSIKEIDGDRVTLTNGTVLHPKLLVAATGWSTESAYLPEGVAAGEYDSLAAADAPRPLYCRFYDQDYPGIFYISVAAGFITYTESANFYSQAVNQILRGTWTPPDEKAIQKNLKEVVLHHISLPGLIEEDLEAAGFKDLRGEE